MYICASVECIEFTRNRTVYRGEWDPALIDPQELQLALLLLSAGRKYNRCRLCREWLDRLGYTPEKAIREALKILSKGSRGDRVIFDPAYGSLIHILVDIRTSRDLPWYWCRYDTEKRRRGTYKTEPLQADPWIYDCNHDGQEWCITLNPWTLDSPDDLDTIISSVGAHQEGTIGKKPFSLESSKTRNESEIKCTFYGASDTTIKTIMIVRSSCCSYFSGASLSSCFPAPVGVCDPDDYGAILYPLYGLGVDIPISTDTPYGLTVRIYTTYP